MYIKFCRSYGEDKKDEASENLSSKLSVELQEEKGKQTEGNIRLYRAVCLFLTLICLILLLVVIALCVKFQNGTAVCAVREETTAAEKRTPTFDPTCSVEECLPYFSNPEAQRLGCMQCSKGWLTFGQSCFYLSTFRLSWAESQRNCTYRGGSLAVVTNQILQTFLTKQGSLKYWIGLRQKGDTWTWVNNDVLQKSYWESNPREGDCGILSGGSPTENNWIKAPCHTTTYFICQLQP